jgi:hypothetical protein
MKSLTTSNGIAIFRIMQKLLAGSLMLLGNLSLLALIHQYSGLKRRRELNYGGKPATFLIFANIVADFVIWCLDRASETLSMIHIKIVPRSLGLTDLVSKNLWFFLKAQKIFAL